MGEVGSSLIGEYFSRKAEGFMRGDSLAGLSRPTLGGEAGGPGGPALPGWWRALAGMNGRDRPPGGPTLPCGGGG